MDGRWQSVNADIIQEFSDNSELYFKLKMYNTASYDTYYGLEYLKDLIPPDYEYVLYNYI